MKCDFCGKIINVSDEAYATYPDGREVHLECMLERLMRSVSCAMIHIADEMDDIIGEYEHPNIHLITDDFQEMIEDGAVGGHHQDGG